MRRQGTIVGGIARDRRVQCVQIERINGQRRLVDREKDQPIVLGQHAALPHDHVSKRQVQAPGPQVAAPLAEEENRQHRTADKTDDQAAVAEQDLHALRQAERRASFQRTLRRSPCRFVIRLTCFFDLLPPQREDPSPLPGPRAVFALHFGGLRPIAAGGSVAALQPPTGRADRTGGKPAPERIHAWDGPREPGRPTTSANRSSSSARRRTRPSSSRWMASINYTSNVALIDRGVRGATDFS